MKILLLFPYAQTRLDRFVDVCFRNAWHLSVIDVHASKMRYPHQVKNIFVTDKLSEDPAYYAEIVDHHPFDVIVPFSEFSVVLAEKLSDYRGLPCNPLDRTEGYRNKLVMRSFLAEAGIDQPKLHASVKGRLSNDDIDLLNDLRYPVVVKPVDSAGSINVRLCRDMPSAIEAIETALRPSWESTLSLDFTPHVLVEEFAEGQEYSREVILSDGQVIFSSNTLKIVTPPPFFDEIGHIVPCSISHEIEEQLRCMVEKVADVYGLRFGVLHIEFKLTASSYKVIEIGFRPAGDHIADLVELVYGVRLEEWLIRSRTGERIERMPIVNEGFSEFAGIKFLFDRPCIPLSVEESDFKPLAIAFEGGAATKTEHQGSHVFNRRGYSICKSTRLAPLRDYIERAC